MAQEELINQVIQKAQNWLSPDYDEETRSQVQNMLQNEDKTDLIDAFYKDLEFGTGGLRGIMGAGSNRMNRYTVGFATQGLTNYLLKEFASLHTIKVVIGHDCRHNSREFAKIAADIFSANGIHVYLFEDLRPTPEISFAIRHLGCQSGIMITASHNPKIYNGYKAYWSDGAQMIAPHDRNVISEVNQIRHVSDVKFKVRPELITLIGTEIDDLFIRSILRTSLSPEAIQAHHDLKIVYTPIHGTGIKLVPRTLTEAGFTQVQTVAEQAVISGDFPTVESPNPEEAAALSMAIEQARATDADIVLATDPDGDRIGSAVKDDSGEWVLLNGNQTCILYAYYAIEKRREAGLLNDNQYLVKTIVTSDLIKTIADHNHVVLFDVYTGFKWIADIMRRQEGKMEYLGGGEESYGYLWEEFVRDKDGVSACFILAEIAAWARTKGLTLYSLLQKIYCDYGYSVERGLSVVRPGKSGADEIEEMMKKFRHHPPQTLAGSPITEILDYSQLKGVTIESGKIKEDFTLDMPVTSNVLQYRSQDGSKLSIRPSGTEPKIKFYFEVHAPVKDCSELPALREQCLDRIETIKKDFGL